MFACAYMFIWTLHMCEGQRQLVFTKWQFTFQCPWAKKMQQMAIHFLWPCWFWWLFSGCCWNGRTCCPPLSGMFFLPSVFHVVHSNLSETVSHHSLPGSLPIVPNHNFMMCLLMYVWKALYPWWLEQCLALSRHWEFSYQWCHSRGENNGLS